MSVYKTIGPLVLVLVPDCQRLGFWSENFFLIVRFHDHCLHLPFPELQD